MDKDIINVALYGGKGLFGGRETPLVARVTQCKMYEKCSYYKSETCLHIVSPKHTTCKHGENQSHTGYTSRAMKYYDFKRKWENHECYSKIKSAPEKIGLIDNEVVIPYTMLNIEIDEQGEIRLKGVSFSRTITYIPSERFTSELIHRIAKFRPRAMMGGEITSYQKEDVPLILAHIKEVLPDKYIEFINSYPEYDTEVDYIGRKALLKTLKPSIIHYRSQRYPKFNEEWYWDGEVLIYKGGYVSDVSITKDYEIEEIKIRPSDKSVITVTDNEQVTKDTVFID